MFCGIPYGLYLDTDTCRVSVDNIRLKFEYKYNNYDFDHRQTVTSVDLISQQLDNQFFTGLDVLWSKLDFFRIGSYCRTCTIKALDWSFAVMIGRYCFDNACKQVAPEVVMDFNPNKVPLDVVQRFVSLLKGSALSVAVQRFDVAFDYALPRAEVRLIEDKAKSYRYFREQGAVTEYQGKRSTHGAMKLYDKTKESELSVPVTRCEITVERSAYKSVADVFPDLFYYGAEQLDVMFGGLPFEVRACILHPDLIEVLRSSCNRHTFQKHIGNVRNYGEKSLVPTSWTEIDRFIRSALTTYTKGVTI